jgi:hypothetical protein
MFVRDRPPADESGFMLHIMAADARTRQMPYSRLAARSCFRWATMAARHSRDSATRPAMSWASISSPVLPRWKPDAPPNDERIHICRSGSRLATTRGARSERDTSTGRGRGLEDTR